LPTPAPQTPAQVGGSKVAVSVAVVSVASLALAGVWFVRKRRRQEASAKKRGHAQSSFLQASDQDLDAHYSAM
jgi:uncharacterized protein HemX